MNERNWSESAAREVEALVEVMFFVACADDDFSIPERRHFAETVGAISDGKLDSGALLELIPNLEKRLQAEGLGRRLQSLAEELSDELVRRLAYGLALQLASADGAIDPREQLVLDQIATAFGLGPDEDEEIAQSVRMSQRPTE